MGQATGGDCNLSLLFAGIKLAVGFRYFVMRSDGGQIGVCSARVDAD